MQIRCFECGRSIDASDPDQLADAFVLHGRNSHQWKLLDTAVRTYARNYVDAVNRLSDDVERRSQIGEITIHPVDASRIADWKVFFDHTAFAGNPAWASCYCLEPHVPPSDENPELPWKQNRSTMVERLLDGRSYGYLAYADGETAGWVNASSRSDYGLYQVDDEAGVDPSRVIGVSCFVVAPPFRGHGVASALLDRVIHDARARGASWIEAYPHNDPRPGDAGHFRGPRSMYETRGFRPIAVREHFTIMRRAC